MRGVFGEWVHWVRGCIECEMYSVRGCVGRGGVLGDKKGI